MLTPLSSPGQNLPCPPPPTIRCCRSHCQKKITAAFNGGTISSDGGVFLLVGADKRLGLIDRLAALFPDSREPVQIPHSIVPGIFEVISYTT